MRLLRFILWIVCAGTLLTGIPLWLFLIRAHRILQNDAILIGGWTLLGALVVLIAILLKTTPPDAIRLSDRAGRWIVLGGAVIFQSAAVILPAPALSEDMIRYRLEGLMWLSGASPYASTPADLLKQSDRVDSIDRTVTFAHLNSIYPPVAQATFAVSRLIENNLISPVPPSHASSWRDLVVGLPLVQRLIILRSLMAIAAVASAAVLLWILAHMGRSPWYAVLFAWNPLVVIETGGMGHIDTVGGLCILLAIRSIQASRGFLAAAFLALSAAVKPPVVLLAPFLARDIGVRRAGVMLVLGALLAMLYVPTLIWQRGYAGWLRTSREYSTRWEANGSIYELIKATADESDGWSVERAKRRARLLAAAAVLGTLAAAWLLRADLAHAGYWVMLAALLTAPVSYPWYLLWVLCFVPLLGGWCGLTALVWSATIAISYLLWRTADWVLPARILAIEYIPVFLALAAELFALASGLPDSPAQPACRRTAAL